MLQVISIVVHLYFCKPRIWTPCIKSNSWRRRCIPRWMEVYIEVLFLMFQHSDTYYDVVLVCGHEFRWKSIATTKVLQEQSMPQSCQCASVSPKLYQWSEERLKSDVRSRRNRFYKRIRDWHEANTAEKYVRDIAYIHTEAKIRCSSEMFSKDLEQLFPIKETR